MIDTKKLLEKLKYLMEQESNQQFEIFDVDADFYTVDSSHGTNGYQLFIKFDYFGVIDSQMPRFATDISKMIEKIEKIVSKVTITPEKKLSLSQEVEVESFINEIDWKIEDKHIFTMDFLVHYLDNN
jgi:hypothetical protein